MANFDEFVNSLEKDFGKQGKGKPFEIFCKWFLQNDPEWSRKVKKVWLWDEYPNKWQTQELGTDLVFHDVDGLTWAVQAKCFSSERATKKGDLNSFLADTGRSEVNKRLWLQTTDKMESKALKTIDGQDKPVTVFSLTNFREARLDYPSSFKELAKSTPKPKPLPDPHQKNAINDVTSSFTTRDRGQLIMACGTGKTFTTLWIKEAIGANNTLVLVPSLNLLSQTMSEWAWAGNDKFEILNVCSDKTTGVPEDMGAAQAPFPVTSEIDGIVSFLKKPCSKVIFCTYQSSDLIEKAQKDKLVPHFDLVVADEAHRCAGKSDSKFSIVLDGTRIRATKRLFATATPRYFGNQKKGSEDENSNVIGMDDLDSFGPVLHQLKFGEAIDYQPEPLLNDFQVVVIGVNKPMIKEWIRSYRLVATKPDDETDARTLAAKIGLLKAIKDYNLKRVISFHSRVEMAKNFAEEIPELIHLIDPKKRPKGKVLSDYISGKMTTNLRKDKLRRLKILDGFDYSVLTNARCLSEGVDVPTLDGISFIDPKNSQTDIIQSVGRAIRKIRGAKNQVKGTIVLPVFIEQGEDHDNEAIIEASNFKPVWSVLKALRAHDEELGEQIDEFRYNLSKKVQRNREKIKKVTLDLPINVNSSFAEALHTKLVECTSESWLFWYGLLENFKSREGHVNVSSEHIEDSHKLGFWVSRQRARKNTLTLKQIEKLDQIGFIWDAVEYAWDTGLKELRKFKESNGHCLVPTNHKKIGNWVTGLRSRKATHSKERIKVLNDLGFIWDIKEAAWEEQFRELSEFEKIHGSCLVPESHIGRNGVYNWIIKQRRDFKRNKSYLTKEKIDKLNSINFIWNLDEYEWGRHFQALEKFYKEHNNTNVPANYTIDELELGRWVRNLRRPQRNLSDQKKKSLNDLGFSWDITEDFWNEGYSLLKKFIAREGHPKVPFGHREDNFKLGGWVASQRARKEKLSYEKQKKLNDVEFVWNTSSARWEKNYKAIVQFRTREGHCMVRQGHRENGLGLGNWIKSQRAKYKEGKLPKNEIKQLDDLGFVWDAIYDPWDETFKLLLKFKDRESHCIVPQDHIEDGFALGRWVTKQRHKKNLSAERREILNQIGFVWDPHKKKWEDAYKHLISFYKREGHCIVYRAHKENGFGLGAWVMSQAKKKDKLPDEQKQKLNDLGFDWKVYRD